MSKDNAWIWIVAIVAAIVFIPVMAIKLATGIFPWESAKSDPMHDDGTYIVGDNIKPGAYIVSPDNDDVTGYWARCADIYCQPDFDLNTNTGMLESDAVTAPTLLFISPDDYAVILKNIELEPMLETE